MPEAEPNAPAARIAVIGAGPAGLIAAERLAQAGCAVTVYERMPTPGRRFLMAGIGGLNLTHAEPFPAFFARYREAAPWLERHLSAFGPTALREWADGLGAECFEGTSGRIFPKAMKASPLLRAWLARLDALGVRIETRHDWRGFDGTALLFDTPEGQRRVEPDATVLALGGASWPRLGATGDWQGPLAEAGIGIAPLAPSNCGVLIDWTPHVADLFAGVPLKNVTLSIGRDEQRGEVVITRRGLEGGAVYALTAPIRAALAAGDAMLALDLKPDMAVADLADRVSGARKGESLANRLRKAARLDPAAAALLREAGPPPGDAAGLATRIKAVPLAVTGLAGIERAISTAGGVTAAFLDDALMLTARPGTFVAGEMLDWEAPTGGYLLTASMATGVAAAQGVLDWISQRDDG